MVSYPTEWQFGRPKGWLVHSETTIKVFVIKKMEQIFYVSDPASYDQVHQAAWDYLVRRSYETGNLINRIRFLDPETIEVTLNKGKTMVTDAKHFDLVRSLDLSIYTNSYGVAKVYYDNRNKLFAKLLLNCDSIGYRDGDYLNCRLSNLKYVKHDGKTRNNRQFFELNCESSQNHAQYFHMFYEELPQNTWMLGKSGGIIKDDGLTWTGHLKVLLDNKQTDYVRTVEKGIDPESSHRELYDWIVNLSGEFNCTQNMVNIQGDTLLVKVEDVIMLTDAIFLPLIQELMLNKTGFSDNSNREGYIGCMYDNKITTFHTVITGYDYVDHINRNRLDNRLSNLRASNHGINNSNRREIPGFKVGVRPYLTRSGAEGYRAYLSYELVIYSRSFQVTPTKDLDYIRREAEEYRIKIFQIEPGKYDTLSNDVSATRVDIKNITAMIGRVDDLIAILNSKTFTLDNYLINVNLSHNQRESMYRYYLANQEYHRNVLSQKRQQLQTDLNLVLAKLAGASARRRQRTN